jgi:hypothetical protein
VSGIDERGEDALDVGGEIGVGQLGGLVRHGPSVSSRRARAAG